MIKRVQLLVFGLIAIFSSFNLQAQESFSVLGKVMSANFNEPLAGALVKSPEGEAVYTDENGNFKMTVVNVPTNISIEFLGFESVTVTPEKNGTSYVTGVIRLKEKTTFLKEVQVSAAQMPFRNSFEGSNYYVSPKLMNDIQPISTEEVLKTIPGVNAIGDMGLSNRLNVSIRGSWGRRSEKVLMLEDGSPISPAPYTAPGVYYNPISDRVDAIEVYTGADILRYGPNNMFGIINYITPKPPQQPGLRAKFSGGQHGYLTGLLSYGGTWNKVGSQIEAVYKKFDGFTDNSNVAMINLNAKIFAELSETQSLYCKISGQFEDNLASLSALTPYTFALDPKQNPFDADRFTMHRYGLDIIHKWLPSKDASLTTKIFASDFARDWWRQVNVVIKAADVRNYVGEEIFSDRYSYLEGHSAGDEDFVRVGRINLGNEATTDSRWHFTVSAIEETFQKSWNHDTWTNQIEFQIKGYSETYKDIVLANDSTRWATNGRFTTDLAYSLKSFSGYVRDHFTWKRFQVTPIVRMEQVWMDQLNRLTASQNPDIDDENELKRNNSYYVIQPGLTLGYQLDHLKVFGSVYRGYIAPSKYFAFLVERDGVLTNPLVDEFDSNIKPEVSLNAELGIRGEFIPGRIYGQVAYFSNSISNFYLAGWNEFFDKLGTIRIQGIEAAMRIECLPLSSDHKFSIQPNLTLLKSTVQSGELVDRHLFSQVKHSQATREEFVNKVNGNPDGYDVFVKNQSGQEIELDRPVTVDDLSFITKTVYRFGDGGIQDGATPYSPPVAFTINLFYSYKNLTAGFGFNHVGKQYAEFANFENESADGAIGVIDPFQSMDVNLNYDLNLERTRCTVFIVCKNLTDKVFVASRLNRGQSGIMPGGFRQINAGINFIF